MFRTIITSALLTLTVMLTASAQTYWTPQTLPMVYLYDNTKYTINPDGVLSQSTVDQLDSTLYRLEHETGVQTVLAVVRHIEGDDPYQFGQTIADTYGIGHEGKDDGLFVMLCTGDRSYTILTGDGLEGVLPDAICRRIQNRIMVPLLQEGNWDEAMIGTIGAIDRYIRGDEDFKQALEDDDADEDLIIGMLIFTGTVCTTLGLSIYFSRRKCRKCGKRKLKLIRSEQFTDEEGSKKLRNTYRCQNCGDEETVIEDYIDDSGMRGGGYGGGPIIGGRMGRGGFGGHHSGPIGGHFGGGHFGGGGSTGRF